MKALTLTQPWATLVAIRAKKIETRGWNTNHRGLLAIHAAKTFPDFAKAMTMQDEFNKPLGLHGYKKISDLPLGMVVATCQLIDVVRITPLTELPTDPEWSFGNYSLGRYMWILRDIVALRIPIPAKGALNLWDWEGVGSQ